MIHKDSDEVAKSVYAFNDGGHCLAGDRHQRNVIVRRLNRKELSVLQ